LPVRLASRVARRSGALAIGAALLCLAAPAHADDPDGSGAPVAAEPGVTTRTYGNLATDEQWWLRPGSGERLDLAPTRGSYADLGRELEQLPGVRLRETGLPGSLAYLSVRGSTPGQVAVLLDRLSLTGAYAASLDLGSLPPDLLAAAELYREAAPLWVGRIGAGGALVLRSSAADAPRRWFALSLGSWRTRRASGGTSAELGGGRLGAALSYRGTEGDFAWYDHLGTPLDTSDDRWARRANNARDQVATLLHWSHEGDSSALSVGTLLQFRTGGLPGHARLPNQAASQQDTRAALTLEHRAWGEQLSLDSDLGIDLSRVAVDDPRTELSAFGESGDARDLRIGLALRPAWRASQAERRLVLRGVIDANTERLTVHRATGDVDAQRDELGAGAEVEGSVGRLAALVNHRATLALDGFEGHGDARWLLATQAMLRLDLDAGPAPRAELRLEVARAERAPTFRERWGGTDATVANDGIENEVRTGAELAFDGRLEAGPWAIRGGVAAWGRRYDSLIVAATNSQGATRFVNIARAEVEGVELSLAPSRGSSYGMAVSGAWQRARELGPTGESDLPHRPRLSATGDAWCAFDTAPMRITLSVPWRASGRFFVDQANMSERPATWEIATRVGVEPSALEGWRAELRVENLLDSQVGEVGWRNGGKTEQVPWAWSDYDGFPLPGRAIYLTLSWSDAR
jgi:vitamin B12 transporter